MIKICENSASKSASSLRRLNGFCVQGVLLGSLMLPCSTVVLAEEMKEADIETVLESIVVYAQKRDQVLQDVPVSMNAITEQDIIQQQITEIEDITKTIPNFTYGQGFGTAQLSIRGIGYGLVTGTGQNSVATYKDGVFISAPQAAAMIQSDIARVEVLRGPQGTLWGRNATGGLVHIITPTPTYQLSYGASALVGSFDRNKQTAYVSGPLTDNLNARISVANDDRGGYFDNYNASGEKIGEVGDMHSKSGNLAADWSPNEKLIVELRSFYAEEFFGGPFYKPLIGDDEVPFPSLGGLPPSVYQTDDTYDIKLDHDPDSDRRLRGVAVTVRATLTDDLELVSITGATKFDMKYDFDADGTALDLITAFRTQETDTFTQEFNLIGSTDKADWVLGYFHLSEEVDSAQTNRITAGAPILAGSIIPAGGILPPDALYPGSPASLAFPQNDIMTPFLYSAFRSVEDKKSNSFFGDLTYSITDSFRVFGGLRLIYEQKDYRIRLTEEIPELTADYANMVANLPPVVAASVPPFALTNTACPQYQYQDLDEEKVTGRLGAQVDVFGNSMLYGSYSTGYKAGGFSASSCNDNYKSEKLDAIEVGLKSTMFDERLKTAVAIFAYDYKDLQLEEVVGTSIVPTNADANIYGLEIEANALLTDSLELNVSAAFNDSEYEDLYLQDRLRLDQGFTVKDNQKGNQLLRTPDWAANVMLKHTLEFSNGARLTSRFNAALTDSMQHRVYESKWDETEAHELYDLSFSYLSPGQTVTVTAFGKNLSDEEVVSNVQDALFTRGVTYAVGRTYGIELRYDY